MFKMFLGGVAWGSGLAIAVVAVWIVATLLAVPMMPGSLTGAPGQPDLTNLKQTPIVTPAPGPDPARRDFTFFKHSAGRMKVPPGGGILAMSATSTAPGSGRPSTYQLWLTESGLWEIRTLEERVELKELPYPDNASVADLDRLMDANLGVARRQSKMIVSAEDLRWLKVKGRSGRDDSLNGKLRMRVEGVVFVQPDPYEK